MTIAIDGPAEDQRMLAEAWARLKKSPFAAALMTELEHERFAIVLRMAPLPGTTAIETEFGERAFHGPKALTQPADGPTSVVFNEAYRMADPAFRARDLPVTFAHEIMGHARRYEAARAGKAVDLFRYHDGNEIDARLAGWLVEFELADGPGDREAWHFARDPHGFVAELKLRHPTYATTFSATEMADPLATLVSRIEAAEVRFSELQAGLKRHRSWYRVIEHFVLVHYHDPAAFTALNAELTATDAVLVHEIEQAQAALRAMLEYTQELLPNATEVTRAWARGLRNPFFKVLASDIETNTAALQKYVAQRRDKGKTGVFANDPRLTLRWNGQITFARLVELYQADDAHFRREMPEIWPSLAEALNELDRKV